VADESVNRIGAMVEELGARIQLVIEAITGFGGRFDKLRDEIFGQFAEVGGQMRFLSEQIAEGKRGVAIVREDLGLEIARLGEMINQARVEFRTDAGAPRAVMAAERAGENAAAAREELGREIGESSKMLKREIAASTEMTAKRLAVELKQTSKALTNLARKFDRFDDRITIQTRDQDQRLRKLERRGRA